ncbi:MAG: hypothetical protein F6K37_33315 [Moorea sp. SIO4E2]|uniref:hypothetical protein n=1 Tax=Moorena sp. SIO4E2 TaxID=2607826 RepID=UPI0013B739FB|nr:hypothetical protein [Moorena sp. SIO4E2]NEQ10625.1 hypothetical protein [Moorena sp. SIO4E2]
MICNLYISGQWSVVSGQRSAVSHQRSAVSCQPSAVSRQLQIDDYKAIGRRPRFAMKLRPLGHALRTLPRLCD